MGRVAALLVPYYNANTPQSIREIEARDWHAALSPYPEWAIERAARWWKGDENDKRGKRPVEGDILARVKFEMSRVRIAQIRVRQFDGEVTYFDDTAPPAAPSKPRCSADAAARILKEKGFQPKRMSQ